MTSTTLTSSPTKTMIIVMMYYGERETISPWLRSRGSITMTSNAFFSNQAPIHPTVLNSMANLARTIVDLVSEDESIEREIYLRRLESSELLTIGY